MATIEAPFDLTSLHKWQLSAWRGANPVRVLYVDEDITQIEQAQAYLEQEGLKSEVTRVSTMDALEQSLANGPYDLILAEFLLPDLHGLAALTLARRLAPETPFIFVTGHVDDGDLDQAIEAIKGGAADFVLKRRMERLPSVVARALQQAADREERKRAELEFISRISHDLRTPLTAIKASIGVVLANEPPGTIEPLQRMFKNIDFASDQMSDMIGNLAELARLQSNLAQLRVGECDLRELAQRIARGVDPVARRRDQQLELDLPRSGLATVADGARLERALLNVLSNATKYGLPGGHLCLRLQRRGREATFSVIDDGPGLPAEELERFYTDPPLRTHPDTHSQRSGIGLFVSRAIIELHGGRMTIQSSAGIGTTVDMMIPLVSG
jgi:signal transduction histidine kinase